MLAIIKRARRWLPFIAVLLAIAVTVPPAGTYARRDAVGQAAQFVIFAVIVPAALANGWPARWRALRVHRTDMPSRHAAQAGAHAAVSLLPFVALVIAWRLPAVLNVLDRDPVLTIAELVTLVSAGTMLWLALTAELAAREPLPRPLRAAMAAVAMWTIWVVAYVTGMSGGTGGAADGRQLAVAVLWAVPAVCFVPVVYATLMRWLGERDGADHAVGSSRSRGREQTGVSYAPRAPRGWRS
jgi:Cytochrome c oxidase caa3 assembly factor (Caa3_CtaG)